MGPRIPNHTQLLRARWFPATIDRPSTVFTFGLLDFFHKLQNRNKCNPYDFYHTIIQQTDATGLDPGIVRSPPSLFHSPLTGSRSTATTRSPWSFAFGVTSNSSNEGVLLTIPVVSSPCRMEALRLYAPPVHTLGKTRLIFLKMSRTNNLYPVCMYPCTHLFVCCKDGRILSSLEWTLASNSS